MKKEKNREMKIKQSDFNVRKDSKLAINNMQNCFDKGFNEDEIKRKQVDHQDRISKLELGSSIFYENGYCSVGDFAKLNSIWITASEIKRLDGEAAKLSREAKVRTGYLPDARWGKAGIYHDLILEELFKKEDLI